LQQAYVSIISQPFGARAPCGPMPAKYDLAALDIANQRRQPRGDIRAHGAAQDDRVGVIQTAVSHREISRLIPNDNAKSSLSP